MLMNTMEEQRRSLEAKIMGRVTEFIEFINEDVIPNNEEMLGLYSYITKTDKLKAVRKKYRKKIKDKTQVGGSK